MIMMRMQSTPLLLLKDFNIILHRKESLLRIGATIGSTSLKMATMNMSRLRERLSRKVENREEAVLRVWEKKLGRTGSNSRSIST